MDTSKPSLKQSKSIPALNFPSLEKPVRQEEAQGKQTMRYSTANTPLPEVPEGKPVISLNIKTKPFFDTNEQSGKSLAA